jgi:hypothetical protein
MLGAHAEEQNMMQNPELREPEALRGVAIQPFIGEVRRRDA